jgi:hypothetical protein
MFVAVPFDTGAGFKNVDLIPQFEFNSFCLRAGLGVHWRTWLLCGHAPLPQSTNPDAASAPFFTFSDPLSSAKKASTSA